jgi:hypothetical protein
MQSKTEDIITTGAVTRKLTAIWVSIMLRPDTGRLLISHSFPFSMDIEQQETLVRHTISDIISGRIGSIISSAPPKAWRTLEPKNRDATAPIRRITIPKIVLKTHKKEPK